MQHLDAVLQAVGRLDLTVDRALGEPDHSGCVVHRDRFTQLFTQPRGISGRCDAQTRNHLQQGKVPHPVVAGPVGPGDSGTVQHKGDAGSVQSHIHQHLIECTVEEGRIDRYDRVHTAVGEPGGRGDCVLLGDAHIHHTPGMSGRHRAQPDRVEHGTGERNDVFTLIGNGGDLLFEH